MLALEYIRGDATAANKPHAMGFDGHIIAHVCNDVGAWGAGFVLSLSKKYPQAEEEYRRWYRRWIIDDVGQPFKLGQVQFVYGDINVRIANMIAQTGISDGTRDNLVPLRYAALHHTLDIVGSAANHMGNFAVVMPKIGCGLAGGDWNKIKNMINEVLCEHHKVSVFVYLLG